MSIFWPASLPMPNKEGFQLTPGAAGRQRRRADTGPGGMRRRSTAITSIMSMTFNLKRRHWAKLDEFVTDTVKGGTLAFYMPDPITDGWPLTDDAGAPMLNEAGQPILMSKTLFCQFGDPLPAITGVKGIEFIVSVTIEVLP